jgi:hypothetical protein
MSAHSVDNDAVLSMTSEQWLEALARAFDLGWNASADYLSADYDGPDDVPNPYEVTRVTPPEVGAP